MECIHSLVQYEKECLIEASQGDLEALVELLESAPLAVATDDCRLPTSRLEQLKIDAKKNLAKKFLIDSQDTTVLRYFGGVYFSFYQAAILDAILASACSAPPKLRDTLIAAALSTASALVNTVGKQFAQPIRPRNKDGSIKSSVGKVALRDRSLDALSIYGGWLSRYALLPKTTTNSKALRLDYQDALVNHGNDFSVVYADPPYTRDHYSRFYHVLETMCLRDNPEISKVVKGGKTEWSRGYYREDRHQSPFCIRSTAPEAFDTLFRMSRNQGLPIVLSYSPHEEGDGTHPRVVSTSQILEIANSYYPNVEVIRVEGAIHNQLNRSDLKLKSREHAEIIVKCFTRRQP